MAATLDAPIQHTFLAVGIVLLILTALVTGFRFYSRRISQVAYGLDDWLALAAIVFFWAEIAFHFYGLYSGGVGLHINEVSEDRLAIQLKALFVVEFLYCASLCCIRVSLAWLMKRIFVQKWFRWSVYVTIFLNVSWLLFIWLDASFICRPVEANWHSQIPGAKCGNRKQSYIIMAVWGILVDVVIWILPWFVIWNLQSTNTKKLELSGVFALGLFDIAVSIIRIVQLERLDFAGDVSYGLAPSEMWTFIEAGVAIIVGNLPCCRYGFIQLFGHSKNLASKRSNYVFSANRSRKGGPQTVSPKGDDELRLWPNALAPTYEARVMHDDKDSHEMVSSSSINDEGYTSRKCGAVNVTREVYLSSENAQSRDL